jgi:uncharacterized paraquat-inducible protein A
LASVDRRRVRRAETLTERLERVRVALDVDLARFAEEWEERDRIDRESRRMVREAETEMRRGFRAGAFPCEACGCFTSSPTAECPRCGNTCSHHEDSARESLEIRKAHGYGS